ncbi:MAG: GNAT family N-acetyltransferase [Myxococcales bacterium]|nr:GNAT family N-acetyltransferase [Myxococcales bacterium]
MHQSFEARTMTERDRVATAEVLAKAMVIDAAYGYLIPDPEKREGALRDFFAGHLRTQLAHHFTFVGVDDGGVVATVTLRRSGLVDPSLWTTIRHGLIPFASAHGWATVRRLFWLKGAYDELEARLAGGEPYTHVHMMAVAPELQGRGVGSRLLAERMSWMDGRRPAILTTHLEQNVVFYERHGFEVLSEETLRPPGGATYRVWSMRRPPQDRLRRSP